MRILKRYKFLCLCSVFFSMNSQAQLYINGATLTIESGAYVAVQGDLTSNTDILGAGKVLMNGTVAQNISMSNKTIPNLEISNGTNVSLTSDTKIGTSLLFTTGKLVLGNFNLSLSSTASASGMLTSKFAETNGTGQLFKELSSDVSTFTMPVGVGTTYRPAYITTTGTYGATAKVGIQALAAAATNKPVRSADYINANWPVTQTGVTGTVYVKGLYQEGDLVGTEANIKGYYNNTTDWSSATGTVDATNNFVGSNITGASGTVTGIGKFVLVGARAFLQGAYAAGTGLMSESLRTGSYIPTSDPYRTTDYATAFGHVNNTTPETVVGTVFNTNPTAADNIVDWVFLELRNTNASPGNTVLQTRSALIQRDGDIVEIDGVSPVSFNNILNGNYAVTVRHRNHLAMSLSPIAGAIALNETKSTAYTTNVMDLRTTASSKIYGATAGYTTANHPTLGTVN